MVAGLLVGVGVERRQVELTGRGCAQQAAVLSPGLGDVEPDVGGRVLGRLDVGRVVVERAGPRIAVGRLVVEHQVGRSGGVPGLRSVGAASTRVVGGVVSAQRLARGLITRGVGEPECRDLPVAAAAVRTWQRIVRLLLRIGDVGLDLLVRPGSAARGRVQGHGDDHPADVVAGAVGAIRGRPRRDHVAVDVAVDVATCKWRRSRIDRATRDGRSGRRRAAVVEQRLRIRAVAAQGELGAVDPDVRVGRYRSSASAGWSAQPRRTGAGGCARARPGPG